MFCGMLGLGVAHAAVTVSALSLASDGALTLTGAVGSAINLGTTATTGNIVIGGAQTSGSITIGNVSGGTSSGATFINAGTGGLNIATTTDARTITFGNVPALQTWNVGNGNAVQTVHLFDHATPANVISIGGANSGVTIGGTVTVTSRLLKTIANLTATSGGAQAGAALTKDINVVGTVAAPGDSVQLPAATAGMDITIINRTATSMNVFPQTSDGINGLSVNAAYAVAGNIEARCIAIGSSGVSVWECQKTAGR